MRKRPRPTLSRVNLKATHGTKIVLELRFRWRRGREVEGTPLLREHTAYTRIEGSNPSLSAKVAEKPLIFQGLLCAPAWAHAARGHTNPIVLRGRPSSVRFPAVHIPDRSPFPCGVDDVPTYGSEVSRGQIRQASNGVLVGGQRCGQPEPFAVIAQQRNPLTRLQVIKRIFVERRIEAASSYPSDSSMQ